MENRRDIAARIRSLREDNDFTIEEMAEATGRSPKEYAARESGDMDLTFTFVYKCAKKLGVDVVELLTGESPRLRHYEIVRGGEGLVLERHTDFHYLHKAPHFKNRLGETFLVDVPYQPESQHEPIHLSYHEGQEMTSCSKAACALGLRTTLRRSAPAIRSSTIPGAVTA